MSRKKLICSHHRRRNAHYFVPIVRYEAIKEFMDAQEISSREVSDRTGISARQVVRAKSGYCSLITLELIVGYLVKEYDFNISTIYIGK